MFPHTVNGSIPRKSSYCLMITGLFPSHFNCMGTTRRSEHDNGDGPRNWKLDAFRLALITACMTDGQVKMFEINTDWKFAVITKRTLEKEYSSATEYWAGKWCLLVSLNVCYFERFPRNFAANLHNGEREIQNRWHIVIQSVNVKGITACHFRLPLVSWP